MPRLQSPDFTYRLIILVAGLLGCFETVVHAETVVLHLSSGDRISGAIVSETTNALVLSNSWISGLSVPLGQVVHRSTNAEAPPLTGLVDLLALRDNSVKGKDASVSPAPNHLKGEAQVGLDLLYGAKDRQIVHGKFKLTYAKPYKSDPKKFFKNTFEYAAEYGTTAVSQGKTNTVTGTTSDRMAASDKTAFDLTEKWYVYNLVGGGYDHVLKINAQYQAGPGVGYHLFTRTNFSMNLEAGLNYQAQYRSDNSEVQDIYYRLAEDFTWKIRDRLSLIEKLEISPRVDLTSQRIRFESTLSYELWKNLSLNLSLLDFYDTQPADNVSRNELQIRSALGVKF
jgi:putative salt-induced outer membrane protein YdiY